MKQIRKLLSLFLVCAILAVGTVVPAAAVEVDRTGWTAISTPEELAAIKTNDTSVKYYLTNDIDLAKYGNFTPIGSSSEYFKGTFDGNGYAIKNMTISGSSYQALFANVAGATIENLTILYSSITATGNYAAAIVAHVGAANFTMTNCYVVNTTVKTTGSGGYGVGGLIGFVEASTSSYITNVSNSGIKGGSVFSYTYGCGGIIGEVYSGKAVISECFCAADSVYAQSYGGAGGMVGIAKGVVEITDCYNLADITCYMGANSTAANYYGAAGGIIGMNNNASNTATYCYNLGTVKGAFAATRFYPTYSGGISGYNVGLTSTSCYNGGTVTSGNYLTNTASEVKNGTIYGYSGSTLTECYYLSGCLATGNFRNVINGTELADNTAMVESIESVFDSGIWKFYGGDTYPTLKNNPESVAPPQPITEDLTLSFVSGTHTNAAFAAVADIPVTVEVGGSETITLPGAPENTGDWVYVFLGWSDGETLYDAGDEFTVSKDTKLTAVWQLCSIDGDGQWTYLDAMTLMDGLAGSITFVPEQTEISDRNSDGSITYLDAMTIMDVLAGIKP